jgi:uncharacterized membrane protein YeaQ/YmgE (transglycosylase-associated protein family)
MDTSPCRCLRSHQRLELVVAVIGAVILLARYYAVPA